jgi:hypothetical protein
MFSSHLQQLDRMQIEQADKRHRSIVRRAVDGAAHFSSGGRRSRSDQTGSRTAFVSASMEYLISFALDRARRMFGSSEPNSKVISLLQYWQLV